MNLVNKTLEPSNIRYQVFQFPNYWRLPMKILTLIRAVDFVGLYVGLIFIGYDYHMNTLLLLAILLFIIHLSLYFLCEELGWKKGTISSGKSAVHFKGAIPLEVSQHQLIRIQTDTNGGRTWYSYGIIEIETKKYDIKIKCSKGMLEKREKEIRALFGE